MVDGVPCIRVLLAEMPPLLRDIVRDILRDAPDIVVVGTVDLGGGPRAGRERLDADVVIASSTGPGDWAAARRFLLDDPRVRVIVLDVGGRIATIHELEPRRIPLGEVSRQTLIEAVRTRGARAVWEGAS